MADRGGGRERRYITPAEYVRLLDAAGRLRNGVRNHLLVMLMYRHGLRVSEALGLRTSHIDFAAQSLCVLRLKSGVSGQHPLLPETAAALRAWLQIRGDRPSNLLFARACGAALSRQQVHVIVRLAGEVAELDVHVHPHMLRHGCGYALANRGVDTRLLQDYLGHRSISSTVVYTATAAERFRGVWGRETASIL